MGLTLSQKKAVNPALQSILNDFNMLKTGEWVPDKHSCEASMDSVRSLARALGVKLKEPNDVQ